VRRQAISVKISGILKKNKTAEVFCASCQATTKKIAATGAKKLKKLLDKAGGFVLKLKCNGRFKKPFIITCCHHKSFVPFISSLPFRVKNNLCKLPIGALAVA